MQRQTLFWLGSLAALLLFLWVFSPILLPFIAGMAIAYFLDPLADRLERIGFPRALAAATILLLFLSIVALLIVVVVPSIVQQMGAFVERLPDLLRGLQQFFEARITPLIERFFPEGLGLQGSFVSIATNASRWAVAVIQQLLSGTQAIFSILSLFVVMPIVAFYILMDWDRIVAQIDEWLPRDHRDTIRDLASQIDRALAGFVRGQLTVSIILGTFYAITLTAMGLNFGLLIGIFAGIINVIPFVGSTLGFLVAVGVAIVQFSPDFLWIAAIGFVFVLGQVVEGNFLQPKLVGSSVGLHPVWLMFGLVAFSYLFGIVGTLIAVPAAAAVGVLIRFGLKRYLESDFYHGTEGEQAGEPKNADQSSP